MRTNFRRKTAWGMVLVTTVALPVLLLEQRLREEWYLHRLSSGASDREHAAGKLAGLDSARAVPLLIEAFRDDRVMPPRDHFAARHLTALRAAAVPALVDALAEDDARVRALAAWVLGDIRPLAAELVPMLIDALEDESHVVRDYAARALLNLGPEHESAIPALVDGLDHDAPHVRVLSANGLRRVGPRARGAVSAMIDAAAADTEGAMPALVTSFLASVGKDALPELVARLKSPDEFVRAFAAETLPNLAPLDRHVVRALMRALDDTSHLVRHRAVVALGKIGEAAAESAPVLLVLLTRDPVCSIRSAALLALTRIGSTRRSLVQRLVVAMHDTCEEVRWSAARALGDLAGEERIGSVVNTMRRALVEDASSRVRRAAAETLAVVGSVAVVALPELMYAVSDPDERLRESAIDAIASLGSAASEATEVLKRATSDRVWRVREAAESALRKVRPGM